MNYILEILHPDDILGVGTGSTVNYFIELLGAHPHRFAAAVASSEASATGLQRQGIRLISLNEAEETAIYVDGADEINPELQLIKGGGGALTREKIVAASARKFLCIADQSKRVDCLGRFPLPIEAIPMATHLIIKNISELGGNAKIRQGFTSDNGNPIIDVSGLTITDPIGLEQQLNQIPGLVTNGLFAMRPADTLLTYGPEGLTLLP